MLARAPAAFAVVLAWCLTASAPAVASEPQLTPFVAEVLWAPVPASGSDGRRHLVYELRIGNTTGSALELKQIEVVDEAAGKVLLSLDRDGLGKRFSIGGRRGAEATDLGVGQFGVVFLHVALDSGETLPRAIAHRVSLRLAQPGVDFSAMAARAPVVDRAPVVLGPPLIGSGYLAGDGCCDSIRHVRALLALNGHFTLAQRFAIDWEQADSENRLVKGDTKTLANYTIYGKEVLAVADGTVVASRNDLPEQVPGALPVGMTVDRADGNFVVLDIGGSYVLYAHMQPGSVTVQAGAKVKRGDVLGKVGNTGNSQAPHLHLHVMDGPSPLVSNGIPYVFELFKLTAIDKAGTADFDKAEATGSPLTLTPVSPPQVLQRVLPLDLTVVEFSAMKTGALATLLAGCCLAVAAAAPASAQADAAAQRAIRDALTKWTDDFNARDTTRICDLFAPDLVYDYRGFPERDYKALCGLLHRSLADRSRNFTYSLEIKEIIVSGDMAVVRLVWTLRVSRDGSSQATETKEPGLDVFRRQPDGTWRIARYIAYEAP